MTARTGAVSAAAIPETSGSPLGADYWLTRGDGESLCAWTARMKAVAQLRIAAGHLARATAAMDRAARDLELFTKGKD